MNYENQICPGCGKPMHEGEDIVVCPDCATPQHRECYNRLGSCVNGYLHASGYVWEPDNSNNAEAQNAPENFQDTPFGQNADEGFFCPICGTKNEPGASVCVNCGSPMPMRINPQMPPLPFMGPMGSGANPFLAGTGIDDGYMINGEKAGDIAVYLKRNQARIIKKFKGFAEDKKKVSWNWGAFLLAPFYFFYRRMTKAGFAFFGLFLAVFLIAAPSLDTQSRILADSKFMSDYAGYVEEFNNGTEITEDQMNELNNEARDAMYEFGMGLVKDTAFDISAVSFILLHLIAGLIADYLLYRKTMNDIKVVRGAVKEEFLLRSSLYKVGGTSVLNFLCSYFTFEIAYRALLTLAEKFIS